MFFEKLTVSEKKRTPWEVDCTASLRFSGTLRCRRNRMMEVNQQQKGKRDGVGDSRQTVETTVTVGKHAAHPLISAG